MTADADTDAIRRVAEDGSDLSKPMEIEFMVVAGDEATAVAIAEVVETRGYATEIEEEDDTVTVYCTKTMLLEHAAVVAAQAELSELAAPHGGTCEGWGTFGNAPGH